MRRVKRVKGNGYRVRGCEGTRLSGYVIEMLTWVWYTFFYTVSGECGSDSKCEGDVMLRMTEGDVREGDVRDLGNFQRIFHPRLELQETVRHVV